MIFKNPQEAIDAGYHYFLCSIHGDYINSAWKDKKTAEAALNSTVYSPKFRTFTPLVLVVDKDL